MTVAILSLALLGAVGADVAATEQRQTLLYIATSPAGAEIFVDGKRVGTTDGLFTVEPGVRRVIVELEGHDQQGKDVTIRVGDVTRLKLRLKKRPQPAQPPSTARHAHNAPAVQPTAEGTRPRDFVQLVVAKERMTFEGQGTTWEELPKLLGKVPTPKYTVLCLSTASDSEISAKQKEEAARCASRLVQDLGFEYLSLASARPLGSKGGPSQIIRTSPKGEITLPMAAVTAGARIRQQYFVQLVVGKNRMTFEGQDTTWEKLPQLLEQIPNRRRTALCLATASDEVTPKQKDEARARAGRLARRHGFEYLSFVGVHPLGSKSGPSQTIRDPSPDERRAQRQLHLKVGEAGLTFEDRIIQTWEELAAAFERVVGREHAEILIVAPARLKQARLVDVIDRASKLADRMSFLPCRVKVASPGRQGRSIDATSPLNEALELIEQNYYVGLDRLDLTEAAIRGMIEELDVHSGYFSQAELASLREQIPEKLSGIGLALRFDQSTRELRVETPLPNMPAHRAGVRAGDTIVQIDGKPTSEFPQEKQLQTAVELIRGKPGSKVTVGLKHSGSDEVEQIEIVREAIRLPAVKGDAREPDSDWDFMLDDDRKIGYVRLTHFNSQSADELRNAVEELQSKGMKAFILDLRNNAGGMLSQAIQVADLFVEDGVIVSVKDRQEPGRTWFAKRAGTLGEFPMVALVNRDSVAAAEIVAACLQDHERAIIVGERTYGKGTAHRMLEFEGSGGALKLPTALFHRPNGKGIHRFDGAEASDTWGVVPDEECEINLSMEEYRQFLVRQRQRDMFSPDGPPASDFVDRQLQKAIEHF